MAKNYFERFERFCRTPSGVRGLKFSIHTKIAQLLQSHPVRGAWIEIKTSRRPASFVKSHPVRGAWIEIR